MFGKCIYSIRRRLCHRSKLALLVGCFWGTGKKALPFTGLRPSFPSIRPSVGAVAADGTMAAAAVVVVSPAMCDAALEAGYFSGYAALPFLSSQRLASNNLQRLAALQSPHVLSWHSMVRRRTPRVAALMRPGQCKPRPWLDQGEKEAHARACARAWKCCTTTTALAILASGSCYIEYARSCLKRIEAADASTAGTTVSPGARRACRGCCCWSCHAVPGRQAQAEHAASLLTSTVCAATTSRLQCRLALLSSYVVVVECSKLNNARWVSEWSVQD